MTAEQLAEKFHNTYERMAPEHGYETRKDSAVPWESVPAKNKGLMIAVCKELLATCQELTIEQLTARFYVVKSQRDRFVEFCRAVLPSNGQDTWDHSTGDMFRQLIERDRASLMELLDRAASFCPVPIQDEIRKAIAKRKDTVHPARLVEALKAIADPEHCLTANSAQGLRDIAAAALQEIDPKNDYSSCVGVGSD